MLLMVEEFNEVLKRKFPTLKTLKFFINESLKLLHNLFSPFHPTSHIIFLNQTCSSLPVTEEAIQQFAIYTEPMHQRIPALYQ